MKRLMKFVTDIVFQDITSLGSLVFFLFISVFFFAWGEYLLFSKLIIILVLSYIIVVLIRTFYHKDRPKKQKHSSYIERIDSSSFPSLHTTRVAALFFLVWWQLDKVLIGVLFLLVFVSVAVSRIVLKKHDFIDVLAGAVLGFLLALLANGVF